MSFLIRRGHFAFLDLLKAELNGDMLRITNLLPQRLGSFAQPQAILRDQSGALPAMSLYPSIRNIKDPNVFVHVVVNDSFASMPRWTRDGSGIIYYMYCGQRPGLDWPRAFNDGDNRGTISWSLRNHSGREIASGVYLIIREGPGGRSVRKVAVIREGVTVTR
jgi:hypothetical protein